jgi:hypothetical protein
MYYKLFTGSFFCAICFFLYSCHSSKHSGSKDVLPGTWQAQPVVIDGDSKDWPSPYPNYDSKAMVAYATSNDKYNLYITMETGDELTQVKILKQGMTVSIDTSGKKDAQLSINYPLENDNDDVDLKRQSRSKSADAQSYENRKMEQNINKLMQSANQFTLDGFSTACNGGYIVSQSSPCGIKVRASIDEYKELVWEVVIPFKAIYNKDSITKAYAGKPISVCFAINAFTHPKKEDSGGGGNSTGGGDASMNNGMAGGGRNSSMHGGGKGGSKQAATDPMEHMYERTKTWKQFGIAFQ